MSAPQTVFYVKCKPQGTDAWPIAREHRIVFLGYPPWRNGAADPSMRTGYSKALFNISVEPTCAPSIPAADRGYRTQVSHNANLVSAVGDGSLVLVPRPEAGVCHLARLSGNFELVDAPEWGQAYLDLRDSQGLPVIPTADHLGDVVQCWRVDEWRTTPFPLVPRWISYRLLSRNTSGIIHGFPELNLDPYQRVSELLNAEAGWSAGTSTVASLLTEWVSPSTFEHLVVQLLQLDAEADEKWHHIGGTGDGGVDGIALSPDGRVVGALQCKWHYHGDLPLLASELAAKMRGTRPHAQIVVAVLLAPHLELPQPHNGIRYLGLPEIASLIERYRDVLPMARTLGVSTMDRALRS